MTVNPLIARAQQHAFLLKARQGLQTSASVNRVSTKDSRFTLVKADGTTSAPTLELQGVIIAANPHKSRQWWAGEYNPSVDAAPDCYSHNGVGPSDRAQNPQAMECAACPKNKWGSAKSKLTGKDIVACGTRKLLAFMPLSEPGVLYQFNLPVTALNNFDGYCADVGMGVHEHGRPLELFDLVTVVSFDTSKGATVGKLLFAQGERLSDAGLTMVFDLLDTGKALELTQENDKPRTAALPAPGVQPRLGAPVQGEVMASNHAGAVAQARAQAAPRQAPTLTLTAGRASAAPAAAAAPTAYQGPSETPTEVESMLGELGFDNS